MFKHCCNCKFEEIYEEAKACDNCICCSNWEHYEPEEEAPEIKDCD